MGAMPPSPAPRSDRSQDRARRSASATRPVARRGRRHRHRRRRVGGGARRGGAPARPRAHAPARNVVSIAPPRAPAPLRRGSPRRARSSSACSSLTPTPARTHRGARPAVRRRRRGLAGGDGGAGVGEGRSDCIPKRASHTIKSTTARETSDREDDESDDELGAHPPAASGKRTTLVDVERRRRDVGERCSTSSWTPPPSRRSRWVSSTRLAHRAQLRTDLVDAADGAQQPAAAKRNCRLHLRRPAPPERAREVADEEQARRRLVDRAARQRDARRLVLEMTVGRRRHARGRGRLERREQIADCGGDLWRRRRRHNRHPPRRAAALEALAEARRAAVREPLERAARRRVLPPRGVDDLREVLALAEEGRGGPRRRAR